MSSGRVGTCGAGVHTIESKAMCPAIKHLNTIVGDDMQRCIVLDARNWLCGLRCAYGAGSIGAMHSEPIIDVELGQVHSSIGTMIAKLHHHEFVEALFVFIGEMLAKLNQDLVSHGLDVPGVACSGEDTCHFKHDQH